MSLLIGDSVSKFTLRYAGEGDSSASIIVTSFKILSSKAVYSIKLIVSLPESSIFVKINQNSEF